MRRFHTFLLVTALVGAVGLGIRPFRRGVWGVVRFPLVVAETAVSTVIRFPQLPALAHDNVTLRSELAARQLELIRLREAVRHLTRTQQLLQSFPHPPGITASIIGRTVMPTEHVVILDKGQRDGLVVDVTVLEAAGLVGRLVEVQPSTSLVLLVTDPNSRVACLVERSREAGLLVGTGESLSQLIYLEMDADVTVGDRIVTAGLGGPFPKGLLVGTVVRISRHERDASTTVWVRPAVRLSQLEEVLCLLPSS